MTGDTHREITSLAPYGDNFHRNLLLEDKVSELTVEVGVETATQAAVRGDVHHGYFLFRPHLQERVLQTDIRQSRKVGDDLLDFLGVRASRQTTFLRFFHLGGSNHLHSAGNLGDVLNAFNAAADLSNIRHGLVFPLFIFV